MRAFVTGGTGFIGRHLVRTLRDRGDEVVALVRSPARAAELRNLGCELVEGDVTSEFVAQSHKVGGEPLRGAMEGCESVFHVAGAYRIGILPRERPAMYDTNVRGTETVLDAAVDSGAKRIVYVSTINIFGDTHGEVVEEGYRRDLSRGFVSYYDETKFLAHEAAEERIRRGAPVVIVQPGGVYGPGDHSELGGQIERAASGKLPFLAFGGVGLNMVHVQDVAEGMLLVHDRGRAGEAYVLGGELARLRSVIEKTARIAGRRPPRFELPVAAMRIAAPLGRLVGPALGAGSNFRELISASNGVTYWATDAKARRELGYSPRDLEAGLAETIGAGRSEGRVPAAG